MKNIVKQIRESTGISQEQFAKELGTTPVTINRWENGKTQLNLMAQKSLYEFCKAHNVDVGNIVVKDYEYPHNDNRLILYHGSREGIVGDIEPKSRGDCDFGSAFYMGTTTLQPLTLVCAEPAPKFYVTELDLSGLKVLNFDIDMDWAMIIAYHRKQMEKAKATSIYEKYSHLLDGYDIAIGYIANDRMYNEISKFFDGSITDVALMNCLSALDLGKQYVALTEKACSQIKILSERAITGFELSVLQEMSIRRRKEGIALAEEIEKKYRREGKYFDEILGGQ